MKTHDVPSHGFAPIRWEHQWPRRRHDTYRLRGKIEGPAFCPDCKAIYNRGKWQWVEKPEGAAEVLCPACHRIRDKYPAGYVILRGPRLPLLRDELLGQIRNEERRASAEHPLERVMAIEEASEEREWVVTTTDVHLARRIGEAIHRAHQGDLSFSYNPDENLVRVEWNC